MMLDWDLEHIKYQIEKENILEDPHYRDKVLQRLYYLAKDSEEAEELRWENSNLESTISDLEDEIDSLNERLSELLDEKGDYND